ncbi:MAG: hypothetical protein EP335_16280 [Alphaproteobacteria bacterium]|nr:MAG: hypothetical protein EP335_16280 [Alphaproteobacteria bacterium]
MVFSRFKTLVIGLGMMLSPLATSTGAQATYGEPIVADPGTYGTLVLGENFSFDICGSTIQGYSLCDIVSDAKYWMGLVIRKQLQYYDQWIDVASLNGSQVDSANGLEYTIATGAGTSYIFEPGTYYVGVAFSTWGQGNTMTASNGTVIQTGNGYYTDWTYSAVFTVAAAGTTPPSTDPSPSNPPASVPEPAGFLILLPMLLGLYWQERRRRVVPVRVR